MTLVPGARLGPYEILVPLGAGGMGEVYRARDPRLERDVAIKVLPAERIAEGRRARFVQEARAASALNHPNIVTVHEIGCADGFDFIVMEYVAGKTLSEHIREGPLPRDEALRIAAQVADALAQAHAAGIVHRDLKPANVMVGPDGGVKLLDFGLAKLVLPGEPLSQQPTLNGRASGPLTHPGGILGTPGYMSPEQVTGKSIDVRSDVFSFGALLYEMLTRRKAFPGRSSAEAMSSVLHHQPLPPSDFAAGLPKELDRLVLRCLQKDPELRVQSMADVKVELREFEAELQAPKSSGEHLSRGRRRPWLPWAVGACILVGLIASISVMRVETSVVPRILSVRPLTAEALRFPPFPSEIPLLTDGPRIYFPEFADSALRPRVVASAGGTSTRLPWNLGRNEFLEAVSPDGGELLMAAFEGSSRSVPEAEYWIVPAIAGAPRRLADVVGHAAEWLRDGRILFAEGNDLAYVNQDGTGRRRLASLPGRPYWPRLSPDGTVVRVTVYTPESNSLWEVRSDGTGLRQLLSGWNDPPNECCGSWTADGRRYVFQATRQHDSQLWALSERRGVLGDRDPGPVQLTQGPVQFRRPCFSRDGRRIFAVGWQLRGELTKIDPVSGRLLSYVPGLSAEMVNHSRDGRWIAYVTYPERELWRARSDGQERLRLSKPGLEASSPSWSPDSKRIAFSSRVANGSEQVLVATRDGASVIELMPGSNPSWSPDGEKLAVRNEHGIQILEIETGRSTTLPGSGALESPAWSPDGRHLLALGRDGALKLPVYDRLVVYDFMTGRWSELLARLLAFPTWSRDSRYIYFRGNRSLVLPEAMYRVNVTNSKVDVVAKLDGVPMVWGIQAFWMGLAGDESPLFLRDLSIHEIYALDWQG
jgi:eukaryotic-like serine/threonine-protein kinase